MLKKIIPLIIFLLLITIAGTAMAQEAADATIAVDQPAIQTTADEAVTAQDLGVAEPTLLPDSKFYFLKNWQRAVQGVFTFGQVKKAELNLKIASEKLLEAQKLAEKTNNPTILNKATELYQDRIEAVQKNIAKFKETATTSVAVSKFLDKFTKQQILQEQIMDKLASQVPTSTLEKIQQVRERQLEQFGQVMQKLEDKNKIQARVQKGLDALKENDLKPLLNLQIIKKLEEKFPTSTIEQIQQVKTEVLQKLNDKLQSMPAQAQQKIENYLEKIQGAVEKKQELLNEIKNSLPAGSTLKQKIDIIKEDLRQNATTTRKYGNDCVCTMNVNSVCGADGKTYGNPCKAKCQNIAIVSQGPCGGKAITTTADQWYPISADANDYAPGCIDTTSIGGCFGQHIIKSAKVSSLINCLEFEINNCNDGVIEVRNDCKTNLTINNKSFPENYFVIDVSRGSAGELIINYADGNFSNYKPQKDDPIELLIKIGGKQTILKYIKTGPLCN